MPATARPTPPATARPTPPATTHPPSAGSRAGHRHAAPGRASGRRLGALVAVALVAAGAAACGAEAGATTGSGQSTGSGQMSATPHCGTGAPKMTVEAEGQASATPDVLTIDMGVTISAPTAAAALADANTQATTLTDSLKGSGVTPADIQSTDFTISPTTTPTGTITGYQVTNTLLVTLHHLAGAGQAIDTAAASVGNAIRINGLTFSVGNTGNVDGQARADAVGTAAAHARSMAAAAGESLRGICSINDTTSSPEPYFATASPEASAGNAAAQVPLEAGTQQATAQVTVVYALAPR